MKYSIEELKGIPKVEVSFQDDFSGSEREYTLTPSYVLSELNKMNIKPKIEDKILLWEKDHDKNNREYYLCNIGRIVEPDENSQKLVNNGVHFDGKIIVISIEEGGYFDLSYG